MFLCVSQVFFLFVTITDRQSKTDFMDASKILLWPSEIIYLITGRANKDSQYVDFKWPSNGFNIKQKYP